MSSREILWRSAAANTLDKPPAARVLLQLKCDSIVALMTELLDLSGDEKVLEIGTGSGYHSAVLSQVAGEVFTIEIIPDLGKEAERLLRSLGFDNVKTRIGNGYLGWPEEAPFDAIILSAAPREIPQQPVVEVRRGRERVIFLQIKAQR